MPLSSPPMRPVSLSPGLRRASRGFRGYPAATVAFYGPDDERATKVAVGIIPSEGAEPSEMKRWSTSSGDIRRDPNVGDAIKAFLKRSGVVSTVLHERLLGCPHEEGVDYPEGESCPECPFWKGRNRWTGAPTEEAPPPNGPPDEPEPPAGEG